MNTGVRSVRVVGLAWGLLALAGSPVAWGQATGVPGVSPRDEKSPVPAKPVLDVNRPKPKAEAPAPEAGDDGPSYRISRFVMRYRVEHTGHPDLASLMDAPVVLGVTDHGYVSARDGVKTVKVRVGDVVEGTPGVFHRSAVNEVARGVAEALVKKGLVGVAVQVDPADIDEEGRDLRPRDRSDLRLIIWTGKARKVSTFAEGPRLQETNAAGEDVTVRVDNPDRVHQRIRSQSPVQVDDVLRKDQIDEFVYRLNRHPGRQVEAVLAPMVGPSDPEAAEVTYRIYEAKPWSVYAQVSNTGTKQTNEWRERIGFVDNQLTGFDDVLRLDYITAGFADSHAVTGSYEFPLLSDRVRLRGFGAYSEFDASNVGQANERFSGSTWQVGAEGSGLVYQDGNMFLDIVAGARFEHVKVTDGLLFPSPLAVGETDFFIPSVGLRFERSGEQVSSLSASVSLEGNIGGIAGTEQDQLDRLGRFESDKNWTVVKYDASYSTYLEPILNADAWTGRKAGSGKGLSLAHEVSARVRGQYAVTGRLIANEQDVVGGLYSVRGYPESVSAGDTTVVGSLEYRFHWPRTFDVGEPGRWGSREMPTFWPFGKDFRWAPTGPFGYTDWDLVFSAFLDAGRTMKNDKVAGEVDSSLLGVGIGVELQIRQNFNLSVDWGVALSDVDEPGKKVSSGDNRVHVVFTVMY